MNRLQRRLAAIAAMAILVVGAVAGASSAGAKSTRGAEDIRGQTITVLVPYRIPPDVIAAFTKATLTRSGVVGFTTATPTKL